MKNLDDLQAFVAVAKELHFGRAAQQLCVSQSVLTQRIKRLENDTGVVLFDRTTRQVALTSAGAELFSHAEDILFHVRLATQRARMLDQEGPELVVATGVSPFAPYASFPRLAREVRQRSPEIGLELRCGPRAEHVDGLVEGRWDVLMCWEAVEHLDSAPACRPGVSTLEMLRQRPHVIVADDHRLAKVRAVTATDLNDETFVTFRPDRQPSVINTLVVDSCRRAGVLPRLGPDVGNLDTLLLTVSAGQAITVLPPAAVEFRAPGCVALPIKGDMGALRLIFAWRCDDQREVVMRVVRAATDLVGGQPA